MLFITEGDLYRLICNSKLPSAEKKAISDHCKGALKRGLPRKAISDHCKGILKRNTPTAGGVQELLYITEGDLYRLYVDIARGA